MAGRPAASDGASDSSDPWLEAAGGGEASSAAQVSAQPLVSRVNEQAPAAALQRGSARPPPLAALTALPRGSAPPPRSKLRRAERFREAFSGVTVLGTSRTREEQLSDARAAKARKREAADAASAPAHTTDAEAASLAIVAPAQKVPSVPEHVLAHALALVGPPREPLPLQVFLRLLPGSPATTVARAEMSRLAEWYLASSAKAGRMASKRATAAATEMSEKNVGSCLCLLASALVHQDRNLRVQVEALFTGPLADADLLCYIEFVSSDETPLRVGVQDSATTIAQASVAPVAPHGAVVHHSVAAPLPPGASRIGVVSKLLQSVCEFAFLVRLRTGRLLVVRGRTHNWLQCLSRTTAECLVAAEEQRRFVSSVASRFQSRTRIATLDSAASNLRAERRIMQPAREGEPKWQHLLLPCAVHQLATTHKRTFALCESDISGQINFSLALNFGTNLCVFGALLQDYVKTHLVVKRGAPPDDAVRHRKHLFRLSMARGSRLLARRLALQLLPNGDWRKRGCVEVYMPDGVPYSHARIADVVAGAIHQCLAASRFCTYPRHRWTRGDRAWDEFIMLESVHGLASAVWPKFCAEISRPARRSPLAAGQLVAPSPSRFAPQPSLPAPPADASGQDSQSTEPPHAATGEEVAGTADQAREENERHRSRATEWLNGQPLTHALIIRQVLEPLRAMMSRLLEVGGRDWQRKQDAAEASGLLAADPSQRRAFPAVEAASGRLERPCHQGLWLLLSEPRLWADLVPLSDHTVSMRHLAFRMLSRADCVIAEFFDDRHAKYPLRLFRLLEQGESAVADIEGAPPCLFDSWSAAFIERHAGTPGGLTSATALAELRVHALLLRIDISTIECTHASIRRRLHSKGVQTHCEDLQELSAEHVLDRMRLQGLAWHTRSAAGDEVAAAQGGVSKSGGRGRGGPWRAFVRTRSYGQPGLRDPRVLSREYHALTPEEMARYEELGRAATQAERVVGQSSFGPRSRDVSRQQAKRFRQNAAAPTAATPASGVATLDAGSGCDVAVQQAVQSCVGTGATMPELLRVARVALRELKARASASARQQEERLAQWEASYRSQVALELAEAFPQAGQIAHALQPLPSRDHLLVECRHPLQSSVSVAQAVFDATSKSNLARALGQAWGQVHRPIWHAPWPEDQPEARGKQSQLPACSSIGFCICGPRGRRLASMRAAFYRQVKQLCPSGSLQRGLLQDAMLVARMVPETDGGSDSLVWSAADAESSPSECNDNVAIYWHVGFMRLSPYAATVRPLAFVGEVPETNALTHQLQALHVRPRSHHRACSPPQPSTGLGTSLSLLVRAFLFALLGRRVMPVLARNALG